MKSSNHKNKIKDQFLKSLLRDKFSAGTNE